MGQEVLEEKNVVTSKAILFFEILINGLELRSAREPVSEHGQWVLGSS